MASLFFYQSHTDLYFQVRMKRSKKLRDIGNLEPEKVRLSFKLRCIMQFCGVKKDAKIEMKIFAVLLWICVRVIMKGFFLMEIIGVHVDDGKCTHK